MGSDAKMVLVDMKRCMVAEPEHPEPVFEVAAQLARVVERYGPFAATVAAGMLLTCFGATLDYLHPPADPAADDEGVSQLAEGLYRQCRESDLNTAQVWRAVGFVVQVLAEGMINERATPAPGFDPQPPMRAA